MSVLQQIEDTLETIRPALKEDGGDVELVGYDDEDGVVRVRLVGVCGACPISEMTVKFGIERRLKMAVPEVQQVQSV